MKKSELMLLDSQLWFLYPYDGGNQETREIDHLIQEGFFEFGENVVYNCAVEYGWTLFNGLPGAETEMWFSLLLWAILESEGE